jgi:hypothetical protein
VQFDVILEQASLHREEPVPSGAEGIWASRARCRGRLRHIVSRQFQGVSQLGREAKAHAIRGGGAKPKDFELAKDRLMAIVLGASRLHLMAAFQEMPYALGRRSC